jgi:hypothetical protein
MDLRVADQSLLPALTLGQEPRPRPRLRSSPVRTLPWSPTDVIPPNRGRCLSVSAVQHRNTQSRWIADDIGAASPLGNSSTGSPSVVCLSSAADGSGKACGRNLRPSRLTGPGTVDPVRPMHTCRHRIPRWRPCGAVQRPRRHCQCMAALCRFVERKIVPANLKGFEDLGLGCQ